MERWQRTLAAAAVAQTVSIVGFNFFTPFLPLFVQQLGVHGVTHITLWAALLTGGTAISMAVSAPFWGVLADRHGRKVMLVRATFSAAVIIGLAGLVQNVWELLLLRILQGSLTGTTTASQALVSSQSPKDRMGFSLGVMQTAIFLGASVGPLLGGITADAVGFRLSFAVAGGVLFCAGVLVTLLVHEERAERETADGQSTRIWADMRQGLSTPGLLPMIGALFAVEFAVTVVSPVLPQFVQYLQGPGGHAATVTGLIFTGGGIAGAVSSVFVGSIADRLGYKRVIVVAALCAAAFSIPQYFVNAAWQLFCLRVGMGFVMGAIMPSASALLASLVPREKRGTAYGLSGSATSLGFASGPLTAAAVVSVAGMRPVFLTAAVAMTIIATWVGTMVQAPAAAGNRVPGGAASRREGPPALARRATRGYERD